jgi:hypothetical protein
LQSLFLTVGCCGSFWLYLLVSLPYYTAASFTGLCAVCCVFVAFTVHRVAYFTVGVIGYIQHPQCTPGTPYYQLGPFGPRRDYTRSSQGPPGGFTPQKNLITLLLHHTI